MKKTFLLIGCLLLLAIGVISVSCKKEEKSKGCTCTFKYQGEPIPEATIKLTEKETEGNSCAKITKDANDFIQASTDEEFMEEFGFEELPAGFDKTELIVSCK